MNCRLSDVTLAKTDGTTKHIDSVYIRGSGILFIVVPDMFANSPMFVADRTVKGMGDGYAGNLRDKTVANKIRMRYF